MEIKELTPREIEPAMALVWRVFLEFEAPEYVPKGIETFRAFIEPDSIRAMMRREEMRIWAAVRDGALVGILAEKGRGHISLLFVQKEFQGQGFGRALFERYAALCRNESTGRITVNSSPYAVPIYHRFGFSDTGAERVANGIRYTPMKYIL